MEKSLLKPKKNISPYIWIVLGFLTVILIGTILLLLPISVQNNENLSFIDALFTSVSGVCVTGLSTIDVYSRLSGFGKIVLLVLIQIGGLGLVSLTVFVFSMLGIKLGIKERVIIREALNQNSLKGLVKLVKTIILATIAIEIIGAILCFFVFINQNDIPTSIAYSIFHSVSSFNNAGYDIFPSESMMDYADNVFLNIITCALIIIGGIGFIVLFDIKENKFFSKLTIHSKIVLCTTAGLLIGGTLLLKFTSWDQLSWLEALFQSVSTRTAGFNSVSLRTLSNASLILMIFLMFIGASPCSTGGGIKTTTFYTMANSMIYFSRGKEATISHRRISDKSIYKSFYITVLALTVVLVAVFMIMVIEDMPFVDILFESFSAFGTVGLSLGITPQLSIPSKLILCWIMFFGRTGPLTIAFLLNSRWKNSTESNIHYIEEKIIIG